MRPKTGQNNTSLADCRVLLSACDATNVFIGFYGGSTRTFSGIRFFFTENCNL
jgi:hypothetical protein